MDFCTSCRTCSGYLFQTEASAFQRLQVQADETCFKEAWGGCSVFGTECRVLLRTHSPTI